MRLVALLLVSLLSVSVVSLAPPARAAGEGTYRVCLDPGHELDGDVGAVATAAIGAHAIQLREVDLNLDVAHAVRRQLLAQRIAVVMTWDAADAGWPETGAPDQPPPPIVSDDPGPNDPLGLEARGRACVDAGAQVMFSVHHNGLSDQRNGLTTLFRDPGFGQRDNDRAVAEIVHDTMWVRLSPGKASRGFINFGLFFDDWAVARGAVGIPTVIFEPVVMTNQTEAQRLVPTIAQAGLRRQHIVDAEVAAVVAVRPLVLAIGESN